MKIWYLLFGLILNGCTAYHGKTPPFYNIDTINNKELIDDNQGIVITNRLFVYNIVYLKDINWPPFMIFSGWDGLSPSNDTIALKLNKGRYFIDNGLEIKRTNPCGIAIDTITKSCDGTPKIGDKPAVIYFDVKPGEVIYIGKVEPNSNYQDDIIDNFELDKKELSKTMPNIANLIKKNLMKKALKPQECNFLIDSRPRCFGGCKDQQSAKLDPRYPACIKALEKLP